MSDPKYNLEHELISRRLLTLDALADAKMNAAASGEPLVEALLERRLIAEDALLDLFHQRLGFPLVDDTYFDKLEPDTLKMIPRDLAIKTRVLPLYKNNDKLFVAAVDPLSPALQEVSYAIGHQLIVCVARPSAILRALSLRYRAPELLRKAPKTKAQIEPIEQPIPLTPKVELELPPIPPPVDIVAQPIPQPPIASLPSLPSLQPQTPMQVLDPAKMDASLSDLFRNTAATVTQRPVSRRIPGPDDYERAKNDIRSAPDRDTVGRILSLFAARYFARVVILAHKQQMLFGWQSVGTDLSASRLKGLIVPLHLPSVFQHIVSNRTYHIGRIEPNMINSAFLAAIGDQDAGHAVIVPIMVEKRVATVLYADTAGAVAPNADLSLVYRLCEEAGQGLSALIRQKRGG